MGIASSSAGACPTVQLEPSKEVHLPFYLSIGLPFGLLISIDKDFCGHLQKLAGVHTSKPLKLTHVYRTVKLHLGKLCQEIQLHWDQLLPIALLSIRSSLTKWMGLSPFEILFGHPSLLVKDLHGDLKKMGDLTLRQQM
jgi:hypothetical protein